MVSLEFRHHILFKVLYKIDSNDFLLVSVHVPQGKKLQNVSQRKTLHK